jgi:hypothetical protein
MSVLSDPTKRRWVAFLALMGLALDAYRPGEVVAGSVAYTELGYRVAFSIITVAVGFAFLCSVWLFFRDRHRADGVAAESTTAYSSGR